MRLSTKGRYGVSAMYELSTYYDERSVSLKEIAQKQEYSMAYLEQLFSTLKKERLITSQRGAKGGYKLAKPPEKITVGDIMRALEGPIELSECVGGSEDYKCNKSSICVTKDIWKEVNDSINTVIDNITLKDLLDKYKSD
ncbi:Rrf2 family transcriptional regulator [Alkalibaculum sp. M08DMB]|uniref:Rrf2 family transcriptional regulator n=1 Tax=Alkalibaculum sporogenes TaxID=2655001 RepID=A0A6A7K9X9_9FIRM|nr:Rrf2 family transcriptional regulator [Alkalibaculum sporogenes]